tara:strand:- start:1895 stop:2512 length:618 start_codon:yes stop_codon:yes gene_type:complete
MVKKNNMKNNLLTNKIVLYLTAFISLFYIINEIVSFNFLPIVIFYLLTIVVYKYTKNMIIVLGIPFIILMLLKLLLKNNKEGFKESKEGKDGTTKKKKDKKGYENLNSDKLSPKIIDSIPNVDKLKKNSKEENIERGLDDLENVLADKNINSISESTEKIVKQQKELMNSLKDITPALGEAMSAIGKIDMNSLTSMFENVNKRPE